ncbi:MAG: LCP family protein [Actinomycetota bacterium]|nr:LCP family protein [Actinomycetota bacterium]
MNDSGRGERPEYKVYRSRRGGPLRGSGDLSRLVERSRKRTDRAPRERKPITPGRVFKWVALAVAGWIAVSVVLFLASAQLQEGTAEGTEEALSGGGNLVTGSTVLLLGSDARIGDSIDQTQRGPSRADSILIMRAGFGSVRKLSIPRDAYAEIPGHTGQKINAAYALGGAGLMVKTVERFLGNGLKVNHVVEVDFNDFPQLIDTLGGITVTNKSRICSPPFDNYYKGYNLPKGDVKVDGGEALGFARVRKNNCAPGENDLDRAERQQEVVSAIRDKLLSPTAFVRLPWISWQAPKTLETDMAGVGLMTLFVDLTTGNQRKTNVLRPSCLGCGPGSSILVSEAERQTAVDRLLGR